MPKESFGGEEISVESTEINPDTLESTMTFVNADNKVVKTISYKNDGSRETQEYDPETGKPKGAPVVRLPEHDHERQQMAEEVEEHIKSLEDKLKNAA